MTNTYTKLVMQFRNCKNLQIAQNIKCTYMTMLCRYHRLQKFHWKKVFGRVLHSINWLTKVFVPWKITKSRHTVLLTCISVHHVYTVVIPVLFVCVWCAGGSSGAWWKTEESDWWQQTWVSFPSCPLSPCQQSGRWSQAFSQRYRPFSWYIFHAILG